MDDAIRTAGRDLAFARAQCGPQATATFEVALRVARMSVAGAFALRQQLDEALSESEPRARADQVRAAGNIADASLGAPFEGLYAAGGSLGIEARLTGPHGSLTVTGHLPFLRAQREYLPAGTSTIHKIERVAL